ncbi:MAG: HAMP domain-containing protein, partial [Calditrichaeota bacterium]
MKRIRTKFVISLLVISLLPVFPVYLLVKNLLERSLKIGYNQNVELALESASTLARELFAKFKRETLAAAEAVARSEWAARAVGGEQASAPALAQLQLPFSGVKVEIFDKNGRLRISTTDTSGHAFPPIYQNILAQLKKKEQPELLNSPGGSRYIRAFAPVRTGREQNGFVVVSRLLAPDFVAGSQRVVQTHQMFKTLDFFESDVTRGFLLAFFVVYLPIAALSIGLGVYFARKMTSPLLELVRGTERVAAGEWDTRVQVSSRDEVGALVQAFNSMVATLKQKQDQVVALEKMAVWREIARVLAHEIKNPLTPIQLTVQQMKDKYSGTDAEYRKLLQECSEIITDEIENLRALVREFSEFARMPKLTLTPGNLNELVEEVRKLYPNDNIQIDLDRTLPETNFDYEKMRRVLINLIENGLDSIREKGSGEIAISTAAEEGRVLLRTRDTGKGMPEEVKTKIFEPYFSTKKSGMGLGLVIVKRVIDEHGGTISVESREGQGTSFTIALPASPATPPADQSHE